MTQIFHKPQSASLSASLPLPNGLCVPVHPVCTLPTTDQTEAIRSHPVHFKHSVSLAVLNLYLRFLFSVLSSLVEIKRKEEKKGRNIFTKSLAVLCILACDVTFAPVSLNHNTDVREN